MVLITQTVLLHITKKKKRCRVHKIDVILRSCDAIHSPLQFFVQFIVNIYTRILHREKVFFFIYLLLYVFMVC